MRCPRPHPFTAAPKRIRRMPSGPVYARIYGEGSADTEENMLEILLVLAFVWLFVGAVRLAFRVAWGAAKITAVILFPF